MNDRERFLAIMDFKPVDRVPNYELAVWGQTIDRWYSEGMPPDVAYWNWFEGEPCFRRILADEERGLAEKYGIEVYPTVLFFKNGKVEKRLDGIYHVGLTKGQLEDFVAGCSL